jgi:hypothetical protein
MTPLPGLFATALSLAVAVTALGMGWGTVRLLPTMALRDEALAMAIAVGVLLGWLLGPRPWCGGMTLRALLAPAADRSLLSGFTVLFLWFLAAGVVGIFGIAAVEFDLDARGFRDPTLGEKAAYVALGLGVASFHGLLCFGWAMGPWVATDRGAVGIWRAAAMMFALVLLCGTAVGDPATAVLLGLVGAAATLAMSLVVLVSGRVWLLILGNFFAWSWPIFVIRLPIYHE